jgi:hypothetical protein
LGLFLSRNDFKIACAFKTLVGPQAFTCGPVGRDLHHAAHTTHTAHIRHATAVGDVPLSVETRLSGAAWFEVMRRPSSVQAGLFDGSQEELA